MGQPQGDYPACSQKVLFVNIWPILWANPLTESPWIRMWQRICPAEPTTSAHTPEECRTHTSGKYAADQIIEQESTPVTTALSGIPDWAVNPFQVLMIRVHGVNLAVPLDRLDTIARWNGAVDTDSRPAPVADWPVSA